MKFINVLAVLTVAALGACANGTNSADVDKALAASLQAPHTCDTTLPGQAILAKYKEGGESSQVPSDLKPFIGAWTGEWENPYNSEPMCGIIVVTYDDTDHAGQPRAVYAWGSAPGVVPGYALVRGRLKEGRLELLDSRNESVVLASLTRHGDNLAGIYENNGSRGLFRKVNDPQAEVQ